MYGGLAWFSACRKTVLLACRVVSEERTVYAGAVRNPTVFSHTADELRKNLLLRSRQ